MLSIISVYRHYHPVQKRPNTENSALSLECGAHVYFMDNYNPRRAEWMALEERGRDVTTHVVRHDCCGYRCIVIIRCWLSLPVGDILHPSPITLLLRPLTPGLLSPNELVVGNARYNFRRNRDLIHTVRNWLEHQIRARFL